MTKREHKWLKAKREEKKRRWFYSEMKKQMYHSIFTCNMAGSKVFINDEGNVQVKVLTPEECLELKYKIDSGEVIPEDTIFQHDIL